MYSLKKGGAFWAAFLQALLVVGEYHVRFCRRCYYGCSCIILQRALLWSCCICKWAHPINQTSSQVRLLIEAAANGSTCIFMRTHLLTNFFVIFVSLLMVCVGVSLSCCNVESWRLAHSVHRLCKERQPTLPKLVLVVVSRPLVNIAPVRNASENSMLVVRKCQKECSRHMFVEVAYLISPCERMQRLEFVLFLLVLACG